MQLRIEYVALDELKEYGANARTHSVEQVAQLADSIRQFGFTNPVLIDEEGVLIAGHGRTEAARSLGMAQVPAITLRGLSDEQRRALRIADNQLALNAGWDLDLLAQEVQALDLDGFDLDLLGFTDDFLKGLLTGDVGAGSEAPEPEAKPGLGDPERKGALAEKFLIPPFSVLNVRDGWWQDRKRSWLALGISSEVGRSDDLTLRTGEDFAGEIFSGVGATSVFDPVLCEIVYRWFSPVGGVVLDPFAGGSVRGIVATKLGRQYVGHELRPEQVAANRQQAIEICFEDALQPAWVEGDSRNLDRTCADVRADLVFSCPPYADLEVYSDDPADLSNMPYGDFLQAYREIIAKACAQLKEDRFACFVVGEVRNKRGAYYDFIGDTVQAFRDAGLEYYNEAILVTPTGSLPIRAGRQFSASRKLGKAHQNVLIFVKGDGKRAAQACGEVDVSDALEEADPASEYGEVM